MVAELLITVILQKPAMDLPKDIQNKGIRQTQISSYQLLVDTSRLDRTAPHGQRFSTETSTANKQHL